MLIYIIYIYIRYTPSCDLAVLALWIPHRLELRSTKLTDEFVLGQLNPDCGFCADIHSGLRRNLMSKKASRRRKKEGEEERTQMWMCKTWLKEQRHDANPWNILKHWPFKRHPTESALTSFVVSEIKRGGWLWVIFLCKQNLQRQLFFGLCVPQIWSFDSQIMSETCKWWGRSSRKKQQRYTEDGKQQTNRLWSLAHSSSCMSESRNHWCKDLKEWIHGYFHQPASQVPYF